jgi:hypothetical protein
MQQQNARNYLEIIAISTVTFQYSNVGGFSVRVLSCGGGGSSSTSSKVIPLHAMEAHGVRGGITPTHS